LLPGTKFHASGSVKCVQPYGDGKPQRCEAFVIRRGVDVTTVKFESGEPYEIVDALIIGG